MKIAVISDTQCKDGVPLDHLTWAGDYLKDKKPDVIVQIGDFSDLPSLSSYDIGKKQFEGRRYKTDIEVAKKAMEMLLSPIWEEQARQRKNKEKVWKPRMVLTLGNHEDRIKRAVENDAKLEGILSLKDLGYEDRGWEVVPFLEPVNIGGIMFSHYFPSGVLGRPVTTARQLIMKKHMSCVAGHLQGRDIAFATRADGVQIMALISGSYYQHNEDYLSPQANNHWRGFYFLHSVSEGAADEMALSLEYLKKRYESKMWKMQAN